MVTGSIDGAARASSPIRAKNSLALPATCKPKKSLICVDAIKRAMPLVNPMMTGRGMKVTALPRCVSPSTIKMTPAIIVTISRPERPKRAMMPATITTNAPVGPAICRRVPPNSETMKPPAIAV